MGNQSGADLDDESERSPKAKQREHPFSNKKVDPDTQSDEKSDFFTQGSRSRSKSPSGKPEIKNQL